MGSLSNSLIVSPRRELDTTNRTVLSKDIKDIYQEVLTPCFIVSDMLDLVSESYGYNKEENTFESTGDFKYKLKGDLPLNKIFFEPAVGTGNFLLQVLMRKFMRVHNKEQLFKAVSTIYGVDIQSNNVLETRLRMLDFIEDNYEILTGEPFTDEMATLFAFILERNIILGNTVYCNSFDHGMKFLDNKGNISHDETLSLYESTFDADLPLDSTHWYDKMYMYYWVWNSKPIRSFVGEKDVDPEKIEGYIIDEPERNDKELVCKFLYYALLPKPKKVKISTPPELKEKKEKTSTSKPKAPKPNKPKASSFSSLGRLTF